MSDFTHFDESGRARMVDVGAKDSTERVAVARGAILMLPKTLERIRGGTIKKGDVLAVADVAAVMAAKKTPDIIPMSHPISITGVTVAFDDGKDSDRGRSRLGVTVTVKCVGQTGVEMEALTATAAALLTVYDMCKAVDRGMTVTGIELVEKKGGKSGHWVRDEEKESGK